ncbi:MAG: Type 1 glutamine amidotransferase-like domain-containing protein [Parcubacteria group bacterium]|jgi:peptidase E
MIEYILQGGGTKEFSFKKYINLWKSLNLIPRKSKVLVVFFARPKETWEMLYKKTKNSNFVFGRWDIEYVLASDNSNEFIKQIKECDVISFRGGNTPKLQKRLAEISDFRQLLEGKITIGSSAGALVFAKYYYDQDYDQIFEGLNFLNIKMITHYKSKGEYAASSGDDKLKMLKSYKEELPVYAIRETEFVVINE